MLEVLQFILSTPKSFIGTLILIFACCCLLYYFGAGLASIKSKPDRVIIKEVIKDGKEYVPVQDDNKCESRQLHECCCKTGSVEEN